MTTGELIDLFDKHNDEFLKFDRVANKFSGRSDLHAFLLLDKLVPGERDIVSAAEHDEIFLDIDLEDLAAAATEAQIVELIRSGVRYDSEFSCLAMFV